MDGALAEGTSDEVILLGVGDRERIGQPLRHQTRRPSFVVLDLLDRDDCARHLASKRSLCQIERQPAPSDPVSERARVVSRQAFRHWYLPCIPHVSLGRTRWGPATGPMTSKEPFLQPY